MGPIDGVRDDFIFFFCRGLPGKQEEASPHGLSTAAKPDKHSDTISCSKARHAQGFLRDRIEEILLPLQAPMVCIVLLCV